MGSTLGSSATVVLAGKIMVIFIIVILLITIFVMFLHLYAKWHWWQIEAPETHRRHQQRRRRRLVFVPADDEEEEEVSIRVRGLHPAVLKSIPIISYSHGGGDEECVCGVCLCEVIEGDKARVLPKCSHAFHVDCIDMWFRSHATCPLCRQNPAPVLELEMTIMVTTPHQTSFTSSMEKQQEDENLNNAFSATGASSSSSSLSSSTDERALVIDIPCL